jgi:hypothetical protein
MKRLQRIEKTKNDVLTTRRLSSEDVKMMTRIKKIKKRVIINEIFCEKHRFIDIHNAKNV